MDGQLNNDQREQLRARLRQLILMRETGPKRAAWHAARARLIWRLHDALREVSQEQQHETGGQIDEETGD
jgi:hypothetical protein